MKKINNSGLTLRLLALLFFLTCNGFLLVSQETVSQVVKSNEKVIIGGKVYYIHHVKKGETIYSISKAYDISERELSIENPDLMMGLKADMPLKIPVKPNEAFIDSEKDKFIQHYVEKGETLSSLSRKYSVKVSDILQYNPAAKDKLDIGQLILVPKQNIEPQHEEFKPEDENYVYHKIEPKETFYSLEKAYYTSEKAIRDANEGLEKGLLIGDVIRIPKSTKASVKTNKSSDSSATKVVLANIPAEKSAEPKAVNCNPRKNMKDRKLNVVLLLPFCIEKSFNKPVIDTTLEEEEGKGGISERSAMFLSFYEGAVVALNKLADEGISTNFIVLDTKGVQSELNSIIKSGKLNNVDLIIGPAHNKDLAYLIKNAKLNNVPIVSPLETTEVQGVNHNLLFQVRPEINSEIDQYCKLIAQNREPNIVIVHSGNASKSDEVDLMRNSLYKALNKETNVKNEVIKEVVYRDSLRILEQALKKGTKNLLIVVSEDKAFSTNVIGAAWGLRNMGYGINLFGYNKWTRFNNIDPEYLFNLNTITFADLHVDYESNETKAFIQSFRDKYLIEPNMYSFHGYDVVGYFTKAVAQYGNSINDCINKVDFNPIQVNYSFIKANNGGYKNKGVYFIGFSDNAMKILNPRK